MHFAVEALEKWATGVALIYNIPLYFNGLPYRRDRMRIGAALAFGDAGRASNRPAARRLQETP
jgi:hypothetical protein